MHYDQNTEDSMIKASQKVEKGRSRIRLRWVSVDSIDVLNDVNDVFFSDVESQWAFALHPSEIAAVLCWNRFGVY